MNPAGACASAFPETMDSVIGCLNGKAPLGDAGWGLCLSRGLICNFVMTIFAGWTRKSSMY
ncbi:hypothetical protein A8U91_00214 [Halomonas elongata]|uniref:Uncharacterized protein n=1 Tax=Halomonas elongata TaxID=2746 RepID=A0A1B8P0X6_HALEL|nr:hypothetical protein A8U91_00214 [Halomonas elongata]